MKKTAALLSLAFALVATPAALHASLTGLHDPGVAYADWDSWTADTANNPTGYGNGSPVFSATLNSNITTSSGGTRAYDFGSAITLDINGIANYAITSFTIQIRATQGNDSAAGDGGPAYLTLGNFLMNGSTTATSFSSSLAGDSLPGGPGGPTPFYIYEWTWSGLDIASGEAFSFSFAPVDTYHSSYDAVRFSAVPEPATTGMLILGAGLAYLVKRRRTQLA